MGKTYEALLRANKMSRSKRLTIVEPDQRTISEKVTPLKFEKRSNLEPYEHLKTNLFTRCRQGELKTILFNGTINGCGCSTTAFNFAISLAKNSSSEILLLEVNLRTPGLKQMLQLKEAPDLVEAVSNPEQNILKALKVGFENLYAICCGVASHAGPTGFFESSEFNTFFDRARKRFDYVILDAPPVPIFSEFRVLCRKVDGVVLVILSEKTRRQVALKAKKEIEAAGGHILGVVLNKRNYYIPKWLYKRL